MCVWGGEQTSSTKPPSLGSHLSRCEKLQSTVTMNSRRASKQARTDPGETHSGRYAGESEQTSVQATVREGHTSSMKFVKSSVMARFVLSSGFPVRWIVLFTRRNCHRVSVRERVSVCASLITYNQAVTLLYTSQPSTHTSLGLTFSQRTEHRNSKTVQDTYVVTDTNTSCHVLGGPLWRAKKTGRSRSRISS